MNFDICELNANIPRIEVERKLFKLGGLKLISKKEIEVHSVRYNLHSTKLQYYGSDYIIDFIVEVRKGILYVISVNAYFLETGING